MASAGRQFINGSPTRPCPEIDKLVALSRLFGVSVGWLLGVEETPEVLQDTGSELTETQLSMVEEIVNRYLTARSRPEKSAWDKWSIRILFALCGVSWPRSPVSAGMSGSWTAKPPACVPPSTM